MERKLVGGCDACFPARVTFMTDAEWKMQVSAEPGGKSRRTLPTPFSLTPICPHTTIVGDVRQDGLKGEYPGIKKKKWKTKPNKRCHGNVTKATLLHMALFRFVVERDTSFLFIRGCQKKLFCNTWMYGEMEVHNCMYVNRWVCFGRTHQLFNYFNN